MQSLTLSRRSSAIDQNPSKLGRAMTFAVALADAALAASAAYAGADTTFTPALTKFTDFLEGSGGKIITVLSLAGGLIGLASGPDGLLARLERGEVWGKMLQNVTCAVGTCWF